MLQPIEMIANIIPFALKQHYVILKTNYNVHGEIQKRIYNNSF